MSDKFKQRFRIPSSRLIDWDYRNNGAYFITICTESREHYFGEIKNGSMELSDIGKLTHQFWAEIPSHFPNVSLDAFVIMPNHTHGIIVIGDDVLGDDVLGDDVLGDDVLGLETLQCNVSTVGMMSDISPKPGSISTIIRSYKSVTTKHARKIHADFGWQTRFHDHIIRDRQSFHRIRNYIINNPKKWGLDELNDD